MVDVAKYHGTGNDFVVVDADEDVPNRRAFAVELCDREHGIDHPASERRGADGVLFLALEPAYSPPRVVMTLVQPDGSVAGMCGNGARCAAKWAAERTGADEVMIDTPSGTRHAEVHGDDVTIEMGAPVFGPAGVPVDRDSPLVEEEVEGLTVTAVDTGVPHAVAFVEDVPDEFIASGARGTESPGVDAVDLESVAPPVRHADVFPKGANVTLASPVEGEAGQAFRQRTFERGVEGETRSCGTGAVAVAAVAHRLGRIESGATVTVSPPGGDLRVTVEAGNSYLHGPVVFEFEAEVPTVAADPDPVDASGD